VITKTRVAYQVKKVYTNFNWFPWVMSYAVLSIFALLVGSIDRGAGRCENPTRRIEYLFPAYGFGCWIFDVSGRDYGQGCKKEDMDG